MRKNYILDFILFFTALVNLVTGIIRFPEILQFIVTNLGSLQVYSLNFIHRWSGILTAFLVILHLVFHWRWILKSSKKIFSKE